MQLWTEYEGVTIDGTFPLHKLLLPEGRSAFFSTANGRGEPVVLRLIECHFDADDILGRWRTVDAFHHPNFLRLDRYGEIELDGGPVVYAVFEKVDANLSAILEEGHLSIADTAQLAASLVSALEMLHNHGFIHEHVEPSSVFAVGDVVKLRSDCLREAPEGEAARAAKQRDVHDLAVVILQALTQRDSIELFQGVKLPAPFDGIVRNGISGAWGLGEIRAALEGRSPFPELIELRPAELPRRVEEPATPSQFKLNYENEIDEVSEEDEDPSSWLGKLNTAAIRQFWDELYEEHFPPQTRAIVIGSLFAALIFFWVWVSVSIWRAHGAHAQESRPAPAEVTSPLTTAQARKPAPTPSPAGRKQWRVIAFTYQARDVAQKKASDLAGKLPSLEASVFTPNGRAPYLVTVGGVMDKETAFALVRQAHNLGLPQDTYAQNYSNISR